MSKTIKIEMIQDDIDRANRQCKRRNSSRSQSCPVAQALRRHFGARHSISVVVTQAWVGDEHFILPAKVTNFITRYDEGKPVKPISFALRKAPQ